MIIIRLAKRVNAWIDRGGDPNNPYNLSTKEVARIIFASVISMTALILTITVIAWGFTVSPGITTLALVILCGPSLYKGARWTLTDNDVKEKKT